MPKRTKAATVDAESTPALTPTFEDALRTLKQLVESLPEQVAERLAAHLAESVDLPEPYVRVSKRDICVVGVELYQWVPTPPPLKAFANRLSTHMLNQRPACDIIRSLGDIIERLKMPPKGSSKKRQIDRIRELQAQRKTVRAIAKELRIKESTVRMCLYRDKAHLRKPWVEIEAPPSANAPAARADG
jgi:hypothetical protein